MRGADPERRQPRGSVIIDHRGERRGLHGERFVVRHDSQAVGADAGDPQSFLDAGMCLRGGVGDEPRCVAVAVDGAIRDAPPGGQDRGQRRLARGSVDHPAAVGAGRSKVLWQAEQLVHPVEHQGLDLGACRAGDPAHPLHPEPGGQQVAEDRGIRGVGREVGEERGCCQWVSPGTITLSVSAMTASNRRGSPEGGCWSWAGCRRAPTCEVTGCDSTRSR